MKINKLEDIDTYRIGDIYFLVQPRTGMVAVLCNWHHEINGIHYWSHHGTKGIYHFLAELSKDKSYVCGKLFHYENIKEFDEDETKKMIKEHIIRERWDKSYTAEEARELWDALEDCNRPEEIYENVEISDIQEMFCYRYRACIDWFWEHWQVFVDMAKDKIKGENCE